MINYLHIFYFITFVYHSYIWSLSTLIIDFMIVHSGEILLYIQISFSNKEHVKLSCLNNRLHDNAILGNSALNSSAFFKQKHGSQTHTWDLFRTASDQGHFAKAIRIVN